MKSDLSDFEVFLSSDWDGEGAQAVAAETLKVAHELVTAVRGEFDLPDASPSVTGALGLVWKINNNYLYISIRSAKTAKFYRRGPNGQSEDQLIEGYSPDDLVKALIEKLLSVNAMRAHAIQPNDLIQKFAVFGSMYRIDSETRRDIFQYEPGKWATPVEAVITNIKAA